MELSDELISQFVDISKNDSEIKYETTVKGIIRVVNDNVYVKIDGSDLLTPVSTIADVEDGERVNVVIKDHSAMVTGNMSSPAARTDAVQTIGNTLVAANARISNLEVNKADISDLNAEKAKIIALQANKADVSDLNAEKAKIVSLEAFRVEATDAVLGFARVSDLDATNARINNLGATYATIVSLDAVKADVQDLETNKLDADTAEITYANIDFANIGTAAIEKFFSESGMIKDLVVSTGSITGEIVGVTISGDRIIGNTIIADKLVIRGDDGVLYKLNTDGLSKEEIEELEEDDTEEQTLKNSLHGSKIIANTITAEKVRVDDLVAFDATIGGFHITNNSLYSGVKASIDNTTTGVYLDSNGQINFGDANNYVKYYILHDEDIGEDVHKLLISADSIMFSVTKKTVDETIESLRSEMIDQTNLENALSEYPKNSDVDDTIDNKLSQYVTNNDIDQANFITESDLIEMDFLTKGVLNDYIRFSEEGIELGSRDNPLILKINEDQIEFINNGEIVSYWDGDYFHTGNIEVDVTERARFGNFAFIPRTDGSLSFLKINNS